jgi:hypothetical protein
MQQRGFRHPKSSLENAAESLLPANHSILLKAVLQLRDSPIRSSPPSSGACDNVTLRDFATQILARNAADFLFPGQSILPKVGVQILPFVALLVGRAQVCRSHRCAGLAGLTGVQLSQVCSSHMRQGNSQEFRHPKSSPKVRLSTQCFNAISSYIPNG